MIKVQEVKMVKKSDQTDGTLNTNINRIFLYDEASVVLKKFPLIGVFYRFANFSQVATAKIAFDNGLDDHKSNGPMVKGQ